MLTVHCLWNSSDASQTTQPLELLNVLSFENLRNHGSIDRNSDANAGDNAAVQSTDNEVGGNHQLDVSDNGKSSQVAHSKTLAGVEALGSSDRHEG